MRSRSFPKKLIALFLVLQNIGIPVLLSQELKNDFYKKLDSKKLDLDYFKKGINFSYILGIGDTLQVIASKDYPELTSIVTIDNEGTIILPRLRRIYVQGLAINELETLLNDAFQKYINYPDVEITIKRFRALQVFVRGEVNNPGIRIMKIKNILNEEPIAQYDQDSVLQNDRRFSLKLGSGSLIQESSLNNRVRYLSPTVFDALKLSGGITNFSDLENVELIRRDLKSNGGGRIKTTLNLKKFLKNGDSTHNLRLYDGDEIIVKKLEFSDDETLNAAVLSDLNSKYIQIFVLGRVNNPGYLKIFKTSSLNDAINFAGGAKILKGPIHYLSFKNDGTIDKRKFRYSSRKKPGSFKNPYLKDGDLIVVGNSAFSLTAELINEITSPFQGIYSTYKLIEAINDE